MVISWWKTCDKLPLELAISPDGIPFKRAKFCHLGSDYSDYSYSDNEANVVSLEKWGVPRAASFSC